MWGLWTNVLVGQEHSRTAVTYLKRTARKVDRNYLHLKTFWRSRCGRDWWEPADG
jgi:hypothetical protein